jgi:Fic family protein
MTLARSVQGSNSIEGYNASLDDVAAAVDGEPTLDANEETQLALAGYRDAMTYVLQAAEDEAATVDEGMIKALHFMMLKHDIGKGPGRWRTRDIAVVNEATGTKVYDGPDDDRIPELIAAMLDELERDGIPALVRAAMAHLNLVMIHPFRDGNGRMARCLQTLVLTRDRIVVPVFSSVEEYLGRNTQLYYDILATTGGGSWQPDNDARPWVRFMLTAHYRQARTHLRRIEEIEQLFAACAEVAAQHRLPERATGGLMDAAMGLRIRRSSYMHAVVYSMGEEISELTATRDLQAMVKAGLLVPRGNTKARIYTAAPALAEKRDSIRASRPLRADYDPFAKAEQRLNRQMTFTD